MWLSNGDRGGWESEGGWQQTQRSTADREGVMGALPP